MTKKKKKKKKKNRNGNAGGGLAMSLIKKLPLLKLLYIGRQKGTGPPQDNVATDSGERNQGDGEDLGRNQPLGHLGVKGMRLRRFLF